MCCDTSPGLIPERADFGQKGSGILRGGAQLRDGDGAVGECLVALAARGDEHGIAARDRVARRLAIFRLKRAAPQDRLWIVEIKLDQELLLGSLCRGVQ